MYFDLLCGVVQALVFTLLTMVYWSLEKGNQPKKEIQMINKVKLQKNINV